MCAHRFDSPSGGCVCGSAWSADYNTCTYVVQDFGNAWSAAWDRYDAEDDYDTDFDCSRGHRGCTRCDRSIFKSGKAVA